MEGGKETNYWPGFVDALANVVVTMVFVLVVFVIALLYFAQNKAKEVVAVAVAAAEAKAAGATPATQQGGETATPKAGAASRNVHQGGPTAADQKGGPQAQQGASTAAGADAALQKKIDALQKENEQLKKALQMAAAQDSTTPSPASGSIRPQAGNVNRSELKVAEQVTAPGASTAPAQIKGAQGAIEILFPAGVTELDKDSLAKLEAAFAALSDKAKAAGLELVSVPEAGGAYSEGRRLAYYRNLAVRNWLIERGLPASAVKMRISDRDTGKPNAVLMVSPSAS
ncbi:MAG: hypothetical protein WCK28_05955 [Burkholderiales bacterium]|jgi:hypothetical protein